MSCQIKLTANISDVASIRRCLFPLDDLRGSDSWLQLCEISASPTGEILALAHDKRLVVVTAKWNSKSSCSVFQITYSDVVDENDAIRSVLCLPIVGQNHSSQAGTDWTCIVLGFQSGHVRFYTESCVLLLEEQLHDENVISVKCQSQHSPRPDINTELHLEELYVHYPSNICVINAGQLFTTLRNIRSQLARVQAKGEIMESVQISTNPKKWGFQDQASVNDAAVVGLDLSNTFDHLLTASVCGGFETRYRAMPPNNTLILGAGSKPYVGFHYALEGGTQPVFTEVAKAVANKLKSALPSWITGSKTQVDKQMSVTLQPAEPMGCRFGLCDLRRIGTDIILSPDHKLAALSDTLGRVMLIDTHKGVCLKMFKGYRDAQCAFIQVPDERKSKHRASNKVALFLIIYSPKKGTIEIYLTQQGVKITTFTASKFSRLLYVNYGLMGFATTTRSRYVCQFTCILIDNDGSIKDFIIPFHFALTEKNSRRARDLHLYKRLKQFIKSDDFDPEKLSTEAYNTCTELKTIEVKMQLIELLMTSREVQAEVILKCVNHFMEELKESEETDENIINLKILLANLNSLLNFYLFILNTREDDENGNVNEDADGGGLNFTLSAKETNNLQKLLDLNTLIDNTKSGELKVSFSNKSDFSTSCFLNTFKLNEPDLITLKEGVENEVLFQTSEFIFKRYITGCSSCYSSLGENFKKSKIVTKDIFKTLLNYWVNRSLVVNVDLEKEMSNLSQLIFTIANTANVDEIIVEYNCTSKFWSGIREILANSTRPFPALTAAILCRNVAQKIEYERDLQQSCNSEDDNIEIWEKLSQENCQWTLLIGKLEDVSLLNIILSNRPKVSDSNANLPKLNHDKVDVSLKYILEKGKGSVSELVARWLTTGGVNPESLVINERLYQKSLSENENTSNQSPQVDEIEDLLPDQIESIKNQPVFDHLNLIKGQFPYSLEVSILLANMCWEYTLMWQKDMQDLSQLEAAIKCLYHIPNVHIKLGLYNLVWNTHLKIVFESACKLINKVGKLPKERLCKQDTGLSDYQLSLFIMTCTEFLDTFMDVIQQSYNSTKTPLQYEPIWENGSQPLVELAQQHSQINYDLVHLHHQLSVTIQMIATFSIKQSKPINNLFDSSILSLFFSDLQQKTQINWHKSDSKVNASRVQFLTKVISASVEEVNVNETSIYSTSHVVWMGKCLALARLWNLDVEILKRYQIVQLFTNGFDSLALELLPAVNDTNNLGPELLAVAGKRLSQFLSTSPNLAEKISALSTNLTNYLDTLNGDWCAPSNIESILLLTTHCLRCLDENQHEYRLACLLLDACSTLQDLQHQ